jgi:hypothetical protein
MSPEKIGENLNCLQFKEVKNGFEWYLDGHVFRIEPFQMQPRYGEKGFRVYFNGSIDGGAYLFDMSLGWVNPSITGVEYTISHPSKKNKDWISDLLKRPSYHCIDTRGIFMKNGVGIVVINDQLHLQVRGKKIKLLEVLKKIELLREELTPVEFDLFSYVEEGIAV